MKKSVLGALAASTLALSSLFITPAATPAQALPVDDTTGFPIAPYPDGVVLVDQELMLTNAEGEDSRPGGAAPGRYFYYRYFVGSNLDTPVVITEFESMVLFEQANDYDYEFCESLIYPMTLPNPTRTEYPVTLEPGEGMWLSDNVTYLYDDGGLPNNECQARSMYFGHPVFLEESGDDDPSSPDMKPAPAPAVQPRAPQRVETAAS